MPLHNIVAQEPVTNLPDAPGYFADIELHTSAELFSVLERVDYHFSDGALQQGSTEPVAFVLHGAEALSLRRDNYQQNRELVDLAAKLSAFGVVDIKVCERWMGNNSIEAAELQPFVGTVAAGVAEVRRLRTKRGFVEF